MVLTAYLVQRFDRRTRVRRARRAVKGETEAVRLAEALGYRVIDRQARRSYPVQIDGEVGEAGVRADFILTKNGREVVGEVKTGGLAPDPSHAPTRRQLLEYAHVFDVDEVLLFDMEAGEARSVHFPGRRRKDHFGWGFLLGWTLGLLGALLLTGRLDVTRIWQDILSLLSP